MLLVLYPRASATARRPFLLFLAIAMTVHTWNGWHGIMESDGPACVRRRSRTRAPWHGAPRGPAAHQRRYFLSVTSRCVSATCSERPVARSQALALGCKAPSSPWANEDKPAPTTGTPPGQPCKRRGDADQSGRVFGSALPPRLLAPGQPKFRGMAT